MKYLLALLLFIAPSVGAQVVETPQPFDSAGRLMAITPGIAARLQLGPPAWRIIGDFTEARLFALGGDAYVIAVTRRDGTVERYSITAADRAYLRERTSTLPPEFLSRPNRGDRNKFIRNQTILGLLVYAPAFAGALTDDGPGAVSAYLLMAGGTFFGASQIARDFTITPAMRSLSTHGALHLAAASGTLAYILGADPDRNDEAINAGIFVGGLAGTAAGLYFGNRMTSGQAVASGFGADVAALTMLGLLVATHGGEEPDDLTKADAALVIAAGAAGYPLGYLYPRSVSYQVTGGDVGTLWLSGLLGVSTAGILLADGEVNATPGALALTTGFLGGIVAGDRLFVRRFDHSAGDAWLMALGGAAGGLMGLGIAYILDEGESGALGMSMFTAGAMGGVALTHRYIGPNADAGRGGVQRDGAGDFASRIRFNAAGAALGVAGVRGSHPLLSIAF